MYVWLEVGQLYEDEDYVLISSLQLFQCNYTFQIDYLCSLSLSLSLSQDLFDDGGLSQDYNFHGDSGGGVAPGPRQPILDYTNPILNMY